MLMKSNSPFKDRSKILIAEDDRDIARNVADALREVGFDTHWIKDGVDAINWIFSSKPRAIILDLTLPRLGGVQICSLVRKTEGVSATPIVVISGQNDTEAKLRLFDVGADDYVTKPFRVEELIARLDAVLTRSTRFRPRTLTAANTPW